jgi:serine/threonine-protein kinase RsbW
MTMRRSFARRIDALDDIVAFTSTALSTTRLDEAQRQTVHFAIEEFFINMVKYAAAGSLEITLEIDGEDGGVQVTLIDTGVDEFDPTKAADARIALPAEQRRPGGLGLHLSRRLVDSLDYEYIAQRREGRTRFVVKAASPC